MPGGSSLPNVWRCFADAARNHRQGGGTGARTTDAKLLVVGVDSALRRELVCATVPRAAPGRGRGLRRALPARPLNALREQIKNCTFGAADAIYRASGGENSTPLYDRIVIVAHSLGSVVAYNVLNILLRTDLPRGGQIDVAGRPNALITFGSPLDKIAFLFSQQHISETQEALAATIQPLLHEPSWRPHWINIYGRNDILGARLDYFDDGVTARVCNLQDPEASTPLAVHTEYWNALLWRTVRAFDDCALVECSSHPPKRAVTRTASFAFLPRGVAQPRARSWYSPHRRNERR